MPESHVFGEDLARSFQNVRQAGTGSIGLLLIGVDRARTLQQSYGMGGVDAALRHTLSKLKTVLPRGAHVYRFVGAELAVLASKVEIDDLCRIAEFTKRAASDDAVDFAPATGGGFPITLSVGIATFECDPQLASGNGIETPDQLVSGAMFALAAGRRQHDKVVVFRRELKKEYEGT
jgi:GGDEF domain-containing protein